jgi:cell division septation protein DedD
VSGAANDVSNSHEPSYYEIALTNRQVVVAFVILLVCLVAAFFSGVWIGRESGTRDAAEQMVRNAPPPAEEKKEGQNLEELDFFDSAKKGKGGKGAKEAKEERPSEPAPAQPAPQPASRPTPQPAAQVAQNDATPRPQTDIDPTLDMGEDTEAGAGAPVPTPAVAGRPKRQKPPAETPAASPAKTPAPAAQQAKAEPPAGRAGKKAAAASAAAEEAEPRSNAGQQAGQLVIQVFSSSEKDQAERIRDRLVSGGHRAYLSPVAVAGRTMYRVRIGPFNSRDKAQKAAEQVRKGYKLDTWVTE